MMIAMITERAESSHDPQWAETGDHYLLKLFRDWIFHRQTDAGGPSVDWGFVVEALNKVCVIVMVFGNSQFVQRCCCQHNLCGRARHGGRFYSQRRAWWLFETHSHKWRRDSLPLIAKVAETHVIQFCLCKKIK